MLWGIAVYGCYFKATAFQSRMFLFWMQTSPLYSCCQVALVGHVCLPLPSHSHWLRPVLGSAHLGMQHRGVLLPQEFSFETCSGCLHGVYFWYWCSTEVGVLLCDMREMALVSCSKQLQSIALRAHGSSWCRNSLHPPEKHVLRKWGCGINSGCLVLCVFRFSWALQQ